MLAGIFIGSNMKIIVLSDTHGNFDSFDTIVRNNKDADMFIHLGDGESEYEDVQNLNPGRDFYYVKGNNDYGLWSASQVIPMGIHKAFATHGHRYSVWNGTELLAANAAANDCDIALYGHTHVRDISMKNGIYIMNPGSADYPRDGKPPCYGVIEISGRDIEMYIREVR